MRLWTDNQDGIAMLPYHEGASNTWGRNQALYKFILAAIKRSEANNLIVKYEKLIDSLLKM